MKPGSAETRGFGYDDLKAINPSLIYCAISAFGQVGPLRGLPGYDPLMQAYTGIMSTTGNDGEAPVRVAVSLIDMGTGMWSAMGILAGVIERSRSGKGVFVEASLLDTGVSWMTVFVASYLATERLPKKLGSAMSMTAPYELFRSADGYVFIAAGNDRLFGCVCEGLGSPDLARDERFRTNPQRVANRVELHREIEALTMARPASEIVTDLRRHGAPCSELNERFADAVERAGGRLPHRGRIAGARRSPSQGHCAADQSRWTQKFRDDASARARRGHQRRPHRTQYRRR